MHITTKRGQMATRARAARRDTDYLSITGTGGPDLLTGPHRRGKSIAECSDAMNKLPLLTTTACLVT